MNGSRPPDDQILVPPVYDDSDEMTAGTASWQLLSVSLHRAVALGFGIAVSGGRDNPHFTSGDPAVVISDVVPNGPAWGLLQVNDRILSANGVSFESIDYAHAVDIIKHAEQINMIVKRKVPVPVMEFEQRTLKFTLSKSRKKEDFGIVVGCRFYIKEIRNPKLAEKDPGLREGDSVLRINGQSVEGATLEEVNKWLERSRDKLCLVIQRDVRRGTSRWPSQNTVYERLGSVNATPRHSPSPMLNHQPLSNRSSHEYMNSPRWRDGSLEERRISSPAVSSNGHAASGIASNGIDYDFYKQDGVRTVAFRKVGGSVGVRVIGGNEVGIFVSAVAADSPAALHGVCCGDRILEVNGRSMRGVTRESAVQLLLSVDDRVCLRLEHARQQFEHLKNNQLGDNFFIRAHFSKEKKSSPLELLVNEGDIFHVTDTLFGGTVGLWQAARVYSSNSPKGEPAKGVIPNQATADTLAREQRRQLESKGRGTLLRRKLDQRRTKSLPKNLLTDPAELSASVPLPAYERVALNTPSFHRPLVLFGPLADVARQLLLSQFSMRFAEPDGDAGVIRLAAVDAVIASLKHCILDISVESVERLQLAQYAPIVVLIDVDGRSRIRDIRKKLSAPHLSSKKLAEQASQIKKHHAHLLSATIDATHEEGWFDALRDLVVHLQQRRLWMPEFPPNLPLEDVLLFPLSSKGSNYDSDMESLKGDYGDYGGKRETSTLSRSIYDWETSQASASSVHAADSPLQSERRGWSTLPRRPAPKLTDPNTNESPEKRLSDESQSTSSRGAQGYYHVKQLLNDDSLYQDARLANEIATVRLREEARIRDERMREEHRSHEREDRDRERDREREVPLQPPNPDMYAPREDTTYSRQQYSGQSYDPRRMEPHPRQSPRITQPSRPSIAPKPNVYSERRWDNSENSRVDSPSLASTSLAPPVQPSPSASPVTTAPSPSPSPAANSAPTPNFRVNGAASPLNPPAETSTKKETTTTEINGNEEEPTVVEERSAIVSSEGAVIRCPASQVELRIPKGAIAEGEKHEVYVKVCREGDCPPIDKEKGETLLSPLVMCGPQGLTFLTPCELRLPHCGSLEADGQWSFSLKAGDGGRWNQLELDQASRNDQFISVPITHF